MGDIFNGGPKYAGDLNDKLPSRPETPDRWRDRVRHAWFLYLVLAVVVPVWVFCFVVMVVDALWFHSGVGFLAWIVVMIPVVVYFRTRQYRLITGRDLDTGEQLGRKD